MDPDAAAVGTVHAFHADVDLPLEPGEQIRRLYLLRHPILQIESVASHWAERIVVDPPFEAAMAKEFAASRRNRQLGNAVDFTEAVHYSEHCDAPLDRMRLIAINAILVSHRRAFAYPTIHPWSMEKLVADVAQLAGFLAYGSGAKLADTEPWAARAQARPARNVHRMRRLGADETYRSWPAAYRRLTAQILETAFVGEHRALGYDLGFVHTA